jgi:hypothetical protein
MSPVLPVSATRDPSATGHGGARHSSRRDREGRRRAGPGERGDQRAFEGVKGSAARGAECETSRANAAAVRDDMFVWAGSQ